MKNVIRSAFAALALAGATVGLQAEVALKVVTIDMEQLFTKYYKTEQHQAKIFEDEKKAKEQLEGMSKERETLVNQAKELQEQIKSPVLSDEARKKAQSDFEAKVAEVRSKESDLQSFYQQTQQLLQKRAGQFQQQALEEISKVANEIAKKKNATMVLNSGATAVVVYVDPAFSITDEVLEAINKDRPAPAINITAPAK